MRRSEHGLFRGETAHPMPARCLVEEAICFGSHRHRGARVSPEVRRSVANGYTFLQPRPSGPHTSRPIRVETCQPQALPLARSRIGAACIAWLGAAVGVARVGSLDARRCRRAWRSGDPRGALAGCAAGTEIPASRHPGRARGQLAVVTPLAIRNGPRGSSWDRRVAAIPRRGVRSDSLLHDHRVAVTPAATERMTGKSWS